MKTLFKFVMVAFIVLFATAAFAQEWTKAQKEVWQVVEDNWTKWKNSDIEGIKLNLHEKYQGWNQDMPLPMSKDKLIKMYVSMKDMVKINSYDIEPARITVIDNAAVVNYYFTVSETIIMGDEKKQQDFKGKNAEFYVKEGGKWLLLGDLTIAGAEDDDDD